MVRKSHDYFKVPTFFVNPLSIRSSFLRNVSVVQYDKYLSSLIEADESSGTRALKAEVMSFTNLRFARVWYCRTVLTVSQRHFLYIYPSHSSRTWINIQIECTCASEVRTPQKQNESKCWILSVHFFECQVSLSYTIFQYTPICAEFSSMLTPIKANQSLIASISSSTGPCRQCRGDPSRKVTITLLVESENRQWKRELTKLWLCAMISNNRLSTGLNNLSTQEIPP